MIDSLVRNIYSLGTQTKFISHSW